MRKAFLTVALGVCALGFSGFAQAEDIANTPPTEIAAKIVEEGDKITCGMTTEVAGFLAQYGVIVGETLEDDTQVASCFPHRC